ncbi:MAG: uracil phosphoribosyltransferase [Muribaculaceae bacterium]
MKIINLASQTSLASQYMAELRDVNVQKCRLRFRENLRRIGQIMAYEISKTLPFKATDVNTPLGTAKCHTVGDDVVIATILRAGLPLHEGILSYFDNAENAFVSAYRKYKEESDEFDIHIEYIASPRIDGKTLIIADPMLATGSSMELAYRALLTKGNPAQIHVVSVIASQQAVDFVARHLPSDHTTLWVAAIDPELNAHSYIVPGLGDAGDLAYGEKE